MIVSLFTPDVQKIKKRFYNLRDILLTILHGCSFPMFKLSKKVLLLLFSALVVTRRMVISRQLLQGHGLFYSYCVIIKNDLNNPVNEYYYDSLKWEGEQRRFLSSRDDLSGKKLKNYCRF